MLGRIALAGAVALAALVPAAASAGTSAQMCRIVIDPRTYNTPLGPVEVPMVYCVSP